jgi:hypothetical protein
MRKNTYRPIIALLLLFLPAHLNAQSKGGYVVGLNLSTLEMKADNLTIPPKRTVNVHFGGTMEFRMARHIAFRPSLLLSAKGSDFTIDTTRISLSPVYLQAPLHIVFSLGPEVLSLQLYAGGYVSAGIGGYKIVGAEELKELKYNGGKTGDLRPFDVGYSFGAGFNINGFIICARYEESITDISHSAITGSEMKNKVIVISISSLFALK